MKMSNEKMRILRMLENGKITAGEAEKLLKAISTDKEGMGFVDRIAEVFSVGVDNIGEISEEFEADKAVINLKACTLRIKESSDSKFRVYGEGKMTHKREAGEVELTLFGSLDMEAPLISSLAINLKVSNLTGIIGVPLKLESAMSDVELSVLRPVDIEAEIKMGNLALSFREPINQHFEVVNSMGTISQNLGLEESNGRVVGLVGKDKGHVKINAKLSSIELTKIKGE
jgi:hypothetical protein